ncbi:MAG: dynamin family protein, partial [Schlesneria sp.]
MTTKPDPFKQKIHDIQRQIGDFIAGEGNERLKKLWLEWNERFNWLRAQSTERPEVEISLIGGTGAGKSTLLNAIIGARVLPVSNMRACTAAISEVAYADGPFRGRVEFISRESWNREVDLLRADFRDAKLPHDREETNEPPHAISRSAIDKLRAVYQVEGDIENFDPFHLVEPKEITQALDSGVIEIEYSSLDEFRREIAVFLDSKHRFWPIVKIVSVRGPFPALSDGAKLVDLPGLNDPNEAREAVTQNYLKTCRFVWIVFNIKRALTKDMINLMQSDDFLRQIVMDGRADALTFVGTASDDVDTESGIEEFELGENATAAEVIAARNHAVRKVVLDQLDELALRLARIARESPETGSRLAAKLKNSKILTVSAREFLRMEGLARTNPAGLAHVDETEVPALKQHMREICQSYGINSYISSLDRHLNSLIGEIEREIQGQLIALRNQAEVSGRQQKEIEAAVQAARAFLDRDLEDSRERLIQDLEASQSLLAERIRRAVDRAHVELEETFKQWGRIHH